MTITPINLIIETAAYGEYAKFRPVLQTCLDALSDARDGIVGVERIGLRFINEVRAPGLQDPREWATYLAAPFVAALDVLPGENIAVSQSVVQTMPHDDVITLVRFGTSKGQAVSSIGPLKVSEVSTDEPFFLLDFDNSWTSNETYDEYSVETVLALCDRLHEPIDQLFEAAITDSARELFRRQP